MLNDYRLIGVCLTGAEVESNSVLLQALQEQASRQNARLLVFHCSQDDREDNAGNHGAFSVFQVINYSLLDLLVIICPTFRNKDHIRQLVSEAQRHSVPVVTLYEQYIGCHTILRSLEEPFTDLLTHLIDRHHVRDFCLLADEAEGEECAEKASIFRSVLDRHAIPVRDRSIIYCSSGDPAVADLADRWIAAGKYPEAIVCTTDELARILCDRLQEHGCRIPDDVIVTGFNNLPNMAAHTPLLTSCVRDYQHTADLIYQILADSCHPDAALHVGLEPYAFRCAESCGCQQFNPACQRSEVERCFHRMDRSFRHEKEIFTWADRLLSAETMEDFRHQLRQNLLKESVLLLNKEAATRPELRAEGLSDLFTVYPASAPDHEEPESFSIEAMYPDLAEKLSSHEAVLFQSVFVDNRVIGYYAACMGDMEQCIHKMYRICRILNLVFHIIDGRRQHQQMASRLVSARSIDPVTGLLNLNGLSSYLTDHYAVLSQQFIAVSVYEIDHYQRIQESEGLEAADQLAAKVGAALSMATEGAVLSRISASTFAVLNHAGTQQAISGMIDAATAPFFKEIGRLQKSLPMGKNELVVHCGCVISRPGWENNLLSFIKAATGELHLNTIKYRQRGGKRTVAHSEDTQLQLHTLLQQNLFTYHFQPIVSAHTGRIYAYEALMRTQYPVKMTPLQILNEASHEARMYDIEHATLFNVMDYISRHQA